MKFKFKTRTDNWEGFFLLSHWSSKKCEGLDLSPLFLKGGSKFWLSLLEEKRGIWKIKKGSERMVHGHVFLKGGGDWHFSCLIFSRFIIFTFRNYFTLFKIVLCIWRKKIFSLTIILWKKVILSCLEMNLKISHKLR